jgi:adenylate cyclase
MIFAGLIFISLRAFIMLMDLEPFFMANPLSDYFTNRSQRLEALIFGLCFGVSFVVIDELAERTRIVRYSFGRVILFKSILYFFAFATILFLLYTLFDAMDIYPENFMWNIINKPYVTRVLVMILVYMGIQVMFLNFLNATARKFGPKVLLNFITGKYQTPKLEDRIFLFMDLKSSTTLAEALGHVSYSQLIKEAFSDINRLIVPYKADIYQYVGDEVVITWKNSGYKSATLAVELFYALHARLTHRSGHYTKKFGIVPEFKAGVHCGQVTVTEVGDIKRDIAYHGDVLNTASRIQGLCNQYQQELLVSGTFKKLLGKDHDYHIEYMDDVILKGKNTPVAVHAIVRQGVEKLETEKDIPLDSSTEPE